MIKRMGMLAVALTLATAAMATSGYAAPRPACLKPDCFASPGCCLNSECDAWCGGTGFGYCGGVSGKEGGCCECVG